MFLFPWLDWCIDISDFEKLIFWVMSGFWHFQPPENVLFWHWSLFSGPHWEGPGWNFSIFFFFGIFQKISKVSKNIFWASYDHVVAQKSIFWTKISKKVAKTLPPPLFTFCRDIVISSIKNLHIFVDITPEANQRMYCICHFSDFFF